MARLWSIRTAPTEIIMNPSQRGGLITRWLGGAGTLKAGMNVVATASFLCKRLAMISVVFCVEHEGFHHPELDSQGQDDEPDHHPLIAVDFHRRRLPQEIPPSVCGLWLYRITAPATLHCFAVNTGCSNLNDHVHHADCRDPLAAALRVASPTQAVTLVQIRPAGHRRRGMLYACRYQVHSAR